MKRATKKWIQQEPLGLSAEECADILDSDARQRAEIRRLKQLVFRLNNEGFTERVVAGIKRALAPKRKRGGGR